MLRVALFWVGYLVILRLAAFPRAMLPAQWGQLVWGLGSTVALIALTIALARRGSPSLQQVGLIPTHGSVRRFLVGALIGVASYAAVVVAVSLLVTPIQFSPAAMPGVGAMSLVVSTTLVLALMEELGFRGYTLRALLPALGVWRTQAIVAVAFGLSHIAFGWELQQVLFGVLPSALLFGAAAHISGGLAMPTGLHAAVNLARIATGETDTPGLWTIAIDESAKGRLASQAPFVGLIVTLFATAALWLWYWRRHGSVPPLTS